MAGYGQDFSLPGEYTELARVLLRAAQHRGRQLNLAVRYRHLGDHSDVSAWYLSADGNGPWIAVWANWLERDLPVIAEGYTGPGSGVRAVRAARAAISRWIDACVGDDGVTEMPLAGADSYQGRYFWPVIDLPEVGHPHEPRLRAANSLLALWMAGLVPHEVALEELHTAIEASLRSRLEAGQAVSWSELVRRAVGTLSQDEIDALGALNRERRRAKHRGGVVGPTEERLPAVLWRGVLVLDHLLVR